MKISRLLSAGVIGILMLGIYFVGYKDGMHDEDSHLIPSVQAAGGSAVQTGWSPTKPYPTHEVYYPGTEELAADEMRVIACGSGMPMPRLKQAAACLLVELGNGDKFIFDMGTGSMERLYALGIPLDYLNKVFLSHLHMDHMGDLPAFYIYGPQNNRSVPLNVWGPGGGGTRPEWGTKAALEHVEKTWAVFFRQPWVE